MSFKNWFYGKSDAEVQLDELMDYREDLSDNLARLREKIILGQRQGRDTSEYERLYQEQFILAKKAEALSAILINQLRSEIW